jgi:hypothetical protein
MLNVAFWVISAWGAGSDPPGLLPTLGLLIE